MNHLCQNNSKRKRNQRDMESGRGREKAFLADKHLKTLLNFKSYVKAVKREYWLISSPPPPQKKTPPEYFLKVNVMIENRNYINNDCLVYLKVLELGWWFFLVAKNKHSQRKSSRLA